MTACLSKVTIASRTSLISADALLVLTTWWTLSRGSVLVQHRSKGSFVYVLLRDGEYCYLQFPRLRPAHERLVPGTIYFM